LSKSAWFELTDHGHGRGAPNGPENDYKYPETAPENQLLLENQSLQAGSKNGTATCHQSNPLIPKNTPKPLPI